jgi:DHA3 family macrolide efflux protein-like MFS transporter
MDRPARTHCMLVFLTVWFGQLVSLIGSGLTGFGLGVWVYQRTGSVTLFALIALCTTLPGIALSPLAGALVDRWDRRLVMMVSDSVAGLNTLLIALLLLCDRLELGHIYLAMAINSVCSTFQWPAYAATVTLLVPKQHLGRANGMLQLGQAAGWIFAPALAGFLVTWLHIHGVLLIDAATFLFALITLLMVQFPRPESTAGSMVGQGSLVQEAAYGWRYIIGRPGLFGQLLLFMVVNFLLGTVSVLATPLVLGFASPEILGTVLSIGGSGMLVGSVLMSLWGGPRPRIHGVLGFTLLIGLAMMLAGLRPSPGLFALAAFLFFFSLPIVNGSSLAIWQTKVDPGLQGRVFAVRNMIASSSLPLAYLAAGPLADHVFEPLLASGGLLASSLGRLIGVGPGRGIGLLFMAMGSTTVLVTIVGYLHPRLRLVEQEIPDALAEVAPSHVKQHAPVGLARSKPVRSAPKTDISAAKRSGGRRS